MKKIDKCRRLPIRLYDNPIGINLHEILQGSLPNRVLIVCSARAAPLGDTLKAAHVFETTVICNTNMDYVFSTVSIFVCLSYTPNVNSFHISISYFKF